MILPVTDMDGVTHNFFSPSQASRTITLENLYLALFRRKIPYGIDSNQGGELEY